MTFGNSPDPARGIRKGSGRASARSTAIASVSRYYRGTSDRFIRVARARHLCAFYGVIFGTRKYQGGESSHGERASFAWKERPWAREHGLVAVLDLVALSSLVVLAPEHAGAPTPKRLTDQSLSAPRPGGEAQPADRAGHGHQHPGRRRRRHPVAAEDQHRRRGADAGADRKLPERRPPRSAPRSRRRTRRRHRPRAAAASCGRSARTRPPARSRRRGFRRAGCGAPRAPSTARDPSAARDAAGRR